MTKIKAIKEAIKDYLSTQAKVDLATEYMEVFGGDDYLYNMDGFNELMDGFDPSEIASKVVQGIFNPDEDYFHFDNYNNLESFTEREADEYVVSYYLDEIAKAIADGEIKAPREVAEAIENAD